MENYSLHHGDCVSVLSTLPAGLVDCCVTSPPYFGLRDYGVEGQIGLEPTPGQFVEKLVAVFREVRRVLRDDGTLWLNLGDSYNAGTNAKRKNGTGDVGNWHTADETGGVRVNVAGLKPKDLIGIPWRVAFALQQPYYTGIIKRIEDRIWLAAMLDAEGCMFIHKRKAGQSNGQGYERKNDTYAPGVEIANTSLAIIERVHKLAGKGSICSQSPDQNNRRKQVIYRWNLRTTECREFVQELYPHLVGKQQQARIICGCPSSGERAEAAHAALISLHRTGVSDIDFDAPPTMFEPGYYLRQDIIWKKPNPMPESVRDRCTKAHEYIFLLSKSARYYFDSDAIKEPCSEATHERAKYRWKRSQNGGGSKESMQGHNYDNDFGDMTVDLEKGKNKRSVWTVTTKPFKGAHFATYPPALIEPCILAGSREGGIVLDPFNGSGTTGEVAIQNGRRYIGIELNAAYLELAKTRIGAAVKRSSGLLF